MICHSINDKKEYFFFELQDEGECVLTETCVIIRTRNTEIRQLHLYGNLHSIWFAFYPRRVHIFEMALLSQKKIVYAGMAGIQRSFLFDVRKIACNACNGTKMAGSL